MHHYPSSMPPNHHFMLNALPLEPVSRTYQYRKIMKPMLERKRRARINKCLDELKDLMTGTLQADGENVSKLEKADILELTVRHLHRLREHNALFVRHASPDALNMEKFWAGFQHCTAEVVQYLNKYDPNVSGNLMRHIANYIPAMRAATQHATRPPAAITTPTPSTTSTATPPPASTPIPTPAIPGTKMDYQRLLAAVNQHVLATVPASQFQEQNSASTSLAQQKTPHRSVPHRMHPYAYPRPLEEVDNANDGDSVWRPW